MSRRERDVAAIANGVCAICDEPIIPGNRVVDWNRSPWGDGDDVAHWRCADNWEPSDEQLEARARSCYPTLTERLEAAQRLK